MNSDIIIIGGGASGLMAAIGASLSGHRQVTILEKMPRPARKIMISGKGRCNFTNLKPWNEFSEHIRSNTNFIRPSFNNFTSEDMIKFLNQNGLDTVVERGDRAYPASYHASDVVDTLVDTAVRQGVRIETETEVTDIEVSDSSIFKITCEDGRTYDCRALIIATGGLSYPTTGSSGDGYKWATKFGHTLKPCFPSLTAIVPKGYKDLGSQNPILDERYVDEIKVETPLKGHIDRSTPLSSLGQLLCGVHLKNVSLSVFSDGRQIQNEFGDLDFTDGGIEGPIGFEVSRNCVKTIINGGKISVSIDLKPAVELIQIKDRVNGLWPGILSDPRSTRLNYKEKLRILLGKLMPWDVITGFLKCNPQLLANAPKPSRGNRYHSQGTEEKIDAEQIAEALKNWKFDIEGFVGYERSVVTAGGIATDEIIAKTLESKLQKGLFFCGEVLDIDSDTGGYNLQTAFSTGLLAGQSAAKVISNQTVL